MVSRFLIIFISFLPITANAYLGPGISVGVIASILGFVAAIFIAIFGIIYYPIKRYLRDRKKRKDDR